MWLKCLLSLKCILVALAIMSFGKHSFAGSVAISMKPTGVFDFSGAVIANDPAAALLASAQFVPGYYRMEIDAQLVGPLAPGEAFGYLTWSFSLGSGLSKPLANVGSFVREAYVSNNPIPNPPIFNSAAVQYFTTFGSNSDTGGDDWQNIFVSLDILNLGETFDSDGNNLIQTDPRTTFVTTAPTKIGQIFVNWNGFQMTTLSTFGVQYSTVTPQGTWSDGNTKYEIGTFQNTFSTSIVFGSFPEPSSIVLLGLGGLGLAAVSHRRRG
jgi:hypothetical protein